MSFEAALYGEIPPLTEEDIARLPIIDPAIVRTLGLREPRKPSLPQLREEESMDIAMQQQHDGYEEDTSDWTPTSATLSETDSEHGSAYPCPGAGFCPVWSRDAGCAYDSGFDDGLKALNHGFGPEPDLTPEHAHSLNRLRRARTSIGGTSSTGSSISLPTTPTAPLSHMTSTQYSLEDMLGKAGKAATVSGALTRKRTRGSVSGLGLGISSRDSSSSLGSEVEVEGGVALTEEAVEQGVPDIGTDE